MYDMWHWGWAGMGLMWILPALLVALVVVLVVGSRRNGGPERQRETAQEILDRRYASGEISREQYEEMKRTLS